MAAEGKTLRANAWRIATSNDVTVIINSYGLDTLLHHLKNSQYCLKPKDKEQEHRNLTQDNIGTAHSIEWSSSSKVSLMT